MRAPLVIAGLFAALAASGCGDDMSSGEAPVESRRSGTVERESYRPPDDGVLTAAQVERFLKVREAALRAPAAPARPGDEGISGATEARAAELTAARSLSVPVEEYLWVRERILEAEAAALTAKLNSDVLALLEKTLASLRERRPSAPDDASRKLLDEQIASFEAEAARVRVEAGEKEPDSVSANLKVLAPFRQKLSVVEEELSSMSSAVRTAPPAPKR